MLFFASTKFIFTRMRRTIKQFCFYLVILFETVQILSKKAKITVYYWGLFIDSILSKSAGISICCVHCSQGCYSYIILTLALSKNAHFQGSKMESAKRCNKVIPYLMRPRSFGLPKTIASHWRKFAQRRILDVFYFSKIKILIKNFVLATQVRIPLKDQLFYKFIFINY